MSVAAVVVAATGAVSVTAVTKAVLIPHVYGIL